MKNNPKYLLTLAFLLVVLASQAQVKKYVIADIKVTGVKHLDPLAVKNLSGLQVNDTIRIPGTDGSTALKKLWKTGLFGDIDLKIDKISGDQVYLNIVLKEQPKVSSLIFEGVSKSKGNTLEEKLEGIKGNVVSEATKKNARNTIINYFKDKGFYFADVKVTQKDDTLLSNGVALRFDINKGKKVKVKKINIEGNKTLKARKIKKKMKIKQYRPLMIFKSSKFVEEKHKKDKARVLEYLNEKGFRDSRILSDSVYKISKRRVNINMQLEENNKFYFRNITWKGNYKYSDEQLAGILGIKKGDVYNKKELDERLNFSFTEQDISSLYMDDGHLFFRITPVETKIDKDSIDIEMRIYEGPQATINAIYINGNTRTSDHVILRELRTKEGQKFSRQNIVRTQQALSQLGYFDPEKIGITPVPHVENSTVDIIYNLEEKPSDKLEVSGGWGGAFGFVGTVGVVFNNFSLRKANKLSNWRPVPTGDGQKLALRIQANGRSFQTYSMTFTEPWLGGRRPNSFSVNLSHSVQRIIRNREVTGSLKVTGISVGLGRMLKRPDDYFSLSNSISYQRYTLKNYPYGGLNFENGNANNLNFTTTLARRSLSHQIYPRHGSSVSLSLALTPPWSLFDKYESPEEYQSLKPEDRYKWIEYHKWMFDASFFTPIAGKLVLNSRLHFGYLNAYNQDKGVGPFERFTMGGSGLSGQNYLLGTDIIGLRGYNDNSIVPYTLKTEERTGGTVYTKYVMELRYPISLSPSFSAFVLTFLEAGNNYSSMTTFDPYKVYRSVGIGARIFMPAFGMIGLDYGIGFDDVPGRPDANGGQFHFTIGQQIR